MKNRLYKQVLSVALSVTLAVGTPTVARPQKAEAADITSDLVGHYTFDGKLNNEVGNGSAKLHGGASVKDGTDYWNISTTGSENYEDGVKGKAYKLLGDTGDVANGGNRGEGLELDAKVSGTDYTVSFWVNPEDYGVATTSLVFADGVFSVNSLNGYRCTTLLGTLWDWDHRGDNFVCLDGDNTDTDTSKAKVDQWTMVTVTNSSGSQKLYLNGEKFAQDSSTNSIVTNVLKDKSIFLGINFWDASFKGLIDEVYVYNRELSEEDVKLLYNDITVKVDAITITPDSPTAVNKYIYASESDKNANNIAKSELGTVQLSAEVSPEDATNKDIIWSIEEGDQEKATVDASGLVTLTDKVPVGGDTITVVATAADGKGAVAKKEITVKVEQEVSAKNVQSIEIADQTLYMGYDETGAMTAGQSVTPEITVTPDDADIKDVTFETDSDIIKIEGNKITALKTGIATVTATPVSNAEAKKTFTVTVKDYEFGKPTSDFAVDSGWGTAGSLYEKVTGNFNITYSFDNRSTGADNWHNFIFDLTDGKGKSRLYRADRWVFETGDPGWGEVGNPDTLWTGGPADWDAFNQDMKKGAAVTVNAVRSGNKLTVTYNITGKESSNIYTMTAASTATEDLPDTLYMRITGEKCECTNVKITSAVTLPERAQVKENETAEVSLGSIIPAGTTITGVASSDDSVVTAKAADDKKKVIVTGIKEGTAVITVETSNSLKVDCEVTVAADVIILTDESQLGQYTDSKPYNRVSVHDPSVVVGYYEGTYSSSSKVYGTQNEAKTRKEIYFVFGSHRAWAYSLDLMNWTTFENNITETSCAEIFKEDAAWSARGGKDYKVSDNLWAPDVIWNPAMNKWCMYMSVNGDKWYTSIVLLTSDSLNGDWTRVGPVVYSGFTTKEEADATDLFKVIGAKEGTEKVPERYTQRRNGNATYNMNAIDPCVVYDEEGTLWMTYGSWFGGIYMLKLDPKTGLRDYGYTYDTVVNVSDAYQGLKLAGGDHRSGEASYLEKIDGRWYLFLSYGALEAKGGYNMRVFFSDKITGPYKDLSGEDARYGGKLSEGEENQVLSANAGDCAKTTGSQLMNYYRWDFMNKGFAAEGHNSAFVDDDGKAYVIYHTRFDDGTEGHQLRVHQLFAAKNGGLVAAPFEYAGETLSSESYDISELAGEYTVILQKPTNYAGLECRTTESVVLNKDGSVTGAYAGTWEQAADGPYVTIKIGNDIYQGVFLKQKMEEQGDGAVCFTLVGNNDLALWGYKMDDPTIAIRKTLNQSIHIPSVTATDLTLPSEGINGCKITWKSSGTALSDNGEVTYLEEDSDIILTATISKGKYRFIKEYKIKVFGSESLSKEQEIELAALYTDEELDISKMSKDNHVSLKNPLYKSGDLSNGAVISFDIKRTAESDRLANIFTLNTSGGAGAAPLLYFSGTGYLGYNGPGGFYDANLGPKYTPADDLLTTGEYVNIKIKLMPDGFEVYKNGTLAYSKETLLAGTTKGGADVKSWFDLGSKLLDWLANSAEELNFGYGNWWPDLVFQGTLKNMKFSYIQPAIDVNGSGLTGLYTQDYEKVADISKEWVSPNAQQWVMLGKDEAHGKFLNYDLTGSGQNSRGAYSWFGDQVADWPEDYQLEYDMALTAGTDQESQFAVATKNAAYKINDGITGGYILKLSSTNSTTWTINDSADSVVLDKGEWVHVKITGTTGQTAAKLTITKADGTVPVKDMAITATDTESIKGFYIRAGRYNGIFQVDNIVIKEKSDIVVTGIDLSETALTLEEGESKIITATVKPDDAVQKDIIWTSSDETVATVDDNGKVTAVKAGTATITAVSKADENVKADCIVTVKGKTSNQNNAGSSGSSSNTNGNANDNNTQNDTQDNNQDDTQGNGNNDTQNDANNTQDNSQNNNQDNNTVIETQGDGTVTTIVTETKPDGTKTEKKEVKTADNTTLVIETETKADGTYTVSSVIKTGTSGKAGTVEISESILKAVAEDSRIDSVVVEITEATINSSEKKNKNAVINVEIPSVEGVSVEKVVLTKDSIAAAKNSGKGLKVNVTNGLTGNKAEGYVVTIPAKQLAKISEDVKEINISVSVENVAKVSDTSKKDDITKLVTKSKGKKAKTCVVEVAENTDVKAGMNLKVPVKDKTGSSKNVYVYKYDKKTGKLVETANSKQKVSEDGTVSIAALEGTDYVVSAKKLSGKKVETIKDGISVSVSKKTAKTGKEISVKVSLPETVSRKDKFGTEKAKITYKSNDKKVASVSKNGKVTTKKKGTTVITTTIKLSSGQKVVKKKKIVVK